MATDAISNYTHTDTHAQMRLATTHTQSVKQLHTHTDASSNYTHTVSEIDGDWSSEQLIRVATPAITNYTHTQGPWELSSCNTWARMWLARRRSMSSIMMRSFWCSTTPICSIIIVRYPPSKDTLHAESNLKIDNLFGFQRIYPAQYFLWWARFFFFNSDNLCSVRTAIICAQCWCAWLCANDCAKFLSDLTI